MSELVIRPLAGSADVEAFRRLNEEWIRTYFTLEDEDRRQLADPVAAYVAPGGQILIAELAGEAIGCVALAPTEAGVFELSKMAVEPARHGAGIGRRLLAAAVEHARELGATTLFLGSNRRLGSAVHLYEQAGFVHVDPDAIHMPYERADVFMELRLR